MRKETINSLFRSYVRANISPKEDERTFVSAVYAAVQKVLGEKNCFLTGSFARFTAVTPIHDLDVFYVISRWMNGANPSATLSELERRLRTEFVNPTPHRVTISRQSHSIGITFSRHGEDVFGIDIVPAYSHGRNEFGDDTYMVPEIAERGHVARMRRYEELRSSLGTMTWIPSDPRGYIEVAKRLNEANEDFRHAVKFTKSWKGAARTRDDLIKLKSFHVEQCVTNFFLANPRATMFDAVFHFFCSLPSALGKPRIADRAVRSRMIDSYVAGLDARNRAAIGEARDSFLVKLETIDTIEIPDLLAGDRYARKSSDEMYLFDETIPVLTEPDENLGIEAFALVRNGFRPKILDKSGYIEVDRQIRFREKNAPSGARLKWKVKNDDASPQRRGEITDGRTRNDPEHTKYKGHHYVECFAVRDGICVARARQDVRLQSA